MELIILFFVSTAIAVIIATVRPAHRRIHKLLHASFRAHYHGPVTSGMDELVSCIASLAYAARYNKTQKARASLSQLEGYCAKSPSIHDLLPVIDWLRNDERGQPDHGSPAVLKILAASFPSLVKAPTGD